jgi:hypothetical protein
MRLVEPRAVNRNKASIARPVQTCQARAFKRPSCIRHAEHDPRAPCQPSIVSTATSKPMPSLRRGTTAACGPRSASRARTRRRADHATGDKAPRVRDPRGHDPVARAPRQTPAPRRDPIAIERSRAARRHRDHAAPHGEHDRRRDGSRGAQTARNPRRRAASAAQPRAPRARSPPRPDRSPAILTRDARTGRQAARGSSQGGLAGPMMRDLRSNGAGRRTRAGRPPLTPRTRRQGRHGHRASV